jgi:hypothetical protein
MGFLGKSPRYINPIILWIDLLIVELGFDDFWGFSIDWFDDFGLWVFYVFPVSRLSMVVGLCVLDRLCMGLTACDISC